jgi:N-acetylgalactosamine-N,N'-diacetylbacillosaminyl-diphospho-undecaprenol 4-alpha-N-acetylgalactosaminyltransferase
VKKKILFINDAIFGGGAELAMRTLIEALSSEKNYEMSIIVLDCKQPDQCKAWCDDYNVNIIYCGRSYSSKFMKLMKYFNILFTFIKMNSEKDYTSLSFQNRSNYLNIILGNFFQFKKIVISERINSTEFFRSGIIGKFHKLLIKNLYPKCHHITANSQETIQNLKKHFSLDEDKMSFIPNGYDFEQVRFMSTRSKLNLQSWERNSGDVIKLVSVGRLEKQKGYLRLISALHRYDREICLPFELLIIGDGSLRSVLTKEVSARKLCEKIKFLGNIENPLPVVKDADIFLFSSYVEGFPNALAEAVILNKRIVTYNFAGGLSSVLENYPNVIIAENEDQFINGIEYLRGRDVVEFTPKYSLDRNIEKYKQILRI